jgi:hypothetical protein
MMGDPYRENESCAGCESRDRTIAILRKTRFDRFRAMILIVAGVIATSLVPIDAKDGAK